MKVLVVSGIWPPDVGGPASHAPEAAEFLLARDHRVEVVTTADAPPAPAPYPVHWIRRSLPLGVRHAATVALVVGGGGAPPRGAERRARGGAPPPPHDVVYSTGMFGRSSLGAALARTPLVVKLTADPAFERLRRWGGFRGSLEEFQRDRSLRTLPLRTLRDLDLRRAAHVITPSSYLRELVIGWGVPAARVTVLPNPLPTRRVDDLRPRDELRAELRLDGPTLVFAGRLTAQKSLDVGIEAARRAGIPLVVAGDGPDRPALERLGHARFLGALPRERVLELLRAGDAMLLSSSWENFPHTVVESLAVGTPVLATRTGGVAEVVVDGENGLLVEPGDADALAAAIRRFVDDGPLAARLRANATASVAGYSAESVYGRLERILRAAAR